MPTIAYSTGRNNMSERSGEPDPNDPNIFLPYVIKHLPHVHDKPALESAVLTLISKATRTHDPRAFTIPLLPRLVAVTLAVPFEKVFSYANVVLNLTRSLVSRRLTREVSSFLIELVALTKRLLGHSTSGPVRFDLPSFPISDELSLPITSSTICAALLVLSLHIPSTYNPPVPISSSTALHQSSSLSIRLWHIVGQHVRGAIISLASRNELLSGQCGPQIASLSINLLLRAFDPANAMPVPATLRRRVADAAARAFSTNSDSSDLLQLLSIASPSRHISANDWSSHVLPHVLRPGPASAFARSLSLHGRVQYACSSSYGPSFPRHRRLNSQSPVFASTEDTSEPPAKRQRLETTSTSIQSASQSHQSTPQASPDPEKSQGTPTPVSHGNVLTYPCSATVTLQRSFEALRNVNHCARDSESALLIAYATHFTADAFHTFDLSLSPPQSEEQTISEWVTFGSPLSRVLLDLSKAVTIDSPHQVWVSLLCLATAAIRLHCALRLFYKVGSPCGSNKRRFRVVDWSSLKTTAFNIFHKALMSFCQSRVGFPAYQLGVLLLKIGQEALSDQSILSNQTSFIKDLVQMSEVTLDSSEQLCSRARAKILKGICRIKYATQSCFPNGLDELSELPTVSTLLPIVSQILSAGSVLESSLIRAVAYEICFSVSCTDSHDCFNGNGLRNMAKCNEGSWIELFDLVKSVIKSGCAEDFVAASSRCLLCLAVHAPDGHFSECVSTFIDMFWLKNGQRVSRAISRSLNYLLDIEKETSRVNGSLEAERQSSSNGNTDINPGNTHKYLHEKLLSHTGMFAESPTSSEQEGRPWDGLNSCALSFYLLLSFDEVTMRKTSGVVCNILLNAVFCELSNQKTLSASAIENGESSGRRAGIPIMKVWNHIVAISVILFENSSWPGTQWLGQPGCREGMRLHPSYPSFSLVQCVVSLISTQLRYWAPILLPRLLNNSDLASYVSVLCGERDTQALFKKLPRYVITPLLQRQDLETLNSLSVRLDSDLQSLAEKYAADSLATIIMADAKVPDDTTMISTVLGKPVLAWLRARCGKIVQRLVMEFGGGLEAKAKKAIVLLGRALFSERYDTEDEVLLCGVMVANQFMLVMDAVNRSLFQSRASQFEKLRYLRTLNAVLETSAKHVHAFVPKILASLKLALDSFHGNPIVCTETIHVWVKFLRILEKGSITDHFASILATLLPYFRQFKIALTDALFPFGHYILNTKHSDRRQNALFFRLTGEADFCQAAFILEKANPFREDLSSVNEATMKEVVRLVDMEQLEEYCKSVGRIIAQYENGFIEVMAAKFFLALLRANRKTIVDSTKAFWPTIPFYGQGVRKGIPSIMKTLIDHVYCSKNKHCQQVLLQCVGEIGAIDPAIVSRATSLSSSSLERSSRTKIRDYPLNVVALVAHLLVDFLIPILSQGENQNLALKSNSNRVGLSIQELLRICGCHRGTAACAGKSAGDPSSTKIDFWETVLVGTTMEENSILFWENLPKSTRDVLLPYLSNPFDVHQYKDVFGGASAGNLQLACQPVWSKIKAAASVGVHTDAREWRRQFVVQLVDFIGTRGSFGEVFRALRPVLRYVDGVTAFVFPLVLTEALDIQEENKGSDLKSFIVGELSEVLTEASSPEIIFDVLDTLRNWRETRCTIQGKKLANEKFGNGGTSASARRRYAVPLLTEHAKDLDPLSTFIDLDSGRLAPPLSLIVQARCAFRAKSFTRAIFLAESHVRNLRRGKNLATWPGLLDTVLASVNTIKNPQLEEAEACSILQKSFAELEDADSMRGIAALRSFSSISELVIDTEVSGQFDETLTTYERAIAENPHSVQFHRGFLRCLMTLGHWETMLSHAQGLVHGKSLHENDLLHTAEANGIEAAWRLSRWDQIKTFASTSAERENYHHEADLEESRSTWPLDFSIAFGNLILSLQSGETKSFKRWTNACRDHLLPPMLRAAREGYTRTYPIVARLHAVADLEDTFEQLEGSMQNDKVTADGTNLDEFTNGSPTIRLTSIESRTKITAPSLKLREPILSTKRVCMERLGSNNKGTLVNLELARLAKDNDNLRLAAAFSFKAMKMSDGDEDLKNSSVMENARIEKSKGSSNVALTLVKNEIARLRELLTLQRKSQDGTEAACRTNDRLSSALVLAGSWIEESRSESSDTILKYFEEAASCGSMREEPFYAMGKHYDSLLQASLNASDVKFTEEPLTARTVRKPLSSGSQGPEHHCQHVPMVIQNYARALCNGHSRIFEALPRMLTVWFDYYTSLDDSTSGYRGVAIETEVRDAVRKSFQNIPLYMWMTAIPQLMSRILHNRKPVREELSVILARVLCEFPDESFWTVVPSSQLKLSVPRKKATESVLTLSMSLLKKDRTQAGKEKAKLFRSQLGHRLAVLNEFIEICGSPGSKDRRGHTENCSHQFAKLNSQLQSYSELNPIIPTLKSLTVRLPDGSPEEHRPFESERVRIDKIDDHVLVMSSLMCPKRIAFLGSDGRQYRYLAKRENNGDMRRDSRVVEFLTIMNRLLSEDRTSRGKGLQLKAYAVLPLTEETGIIEWVNDLCPLRALVAGEHSKLENLPSQAVIKHKYDSTPDKRRFLEEYAMVKFPAVLDKYFVKDFGGGDAQEWLAARNEWTKSCAVWSMSGHVVGLGDRHGENVLIETTSGRCVHVDFAMLFEKGLKLRVPEVVPFRLTQNMVCAMGICGYEGVFRTVCEVVMRVVRRNGDALLSRLESFLYDPMADWGSSQTHGSKAGVMATREAWQARATVKAKLTGMVDNSGIALSIEGQVERLIRDATSLDNLSKMYIWWSAWV